MKMLKVLLVVTCLFIMRHSVAAPIPFNGHHYDLVEGTFTWHEARIAAHALSFMGVQGHLANITSAAENDFLSRNFNNGFPSTFAWIGGLEPNDDGVWKWADGPEAGIQFAAFDLATAPFNYANWGGIEPNDNKPEEDFAMFNIGTSFALVGPGQWADASPSPSGFDPVVGYLVEFIPEPSGFALFAVGCILFIAFRRRC